MQLICCLSSRFVQIRTDFKRIEWFGYFFNSGSPFWFEMIWIDLLIRISLNWFGLIWVFMWFVIRKDLEILHWFEILVDLLFVQIWKELKRFEISIPCLPPSIELNGEDFHIRGSIAFLPELKHFYAIAFTNNNWIIYDDLKTKPESIKQTRHVLCGLI